LSFVDDSRFLFDASFFCTAFTADLLRAAADLVRVEVARRRRVEEASADETFFFFATTFFPAAAAAVAASFFLGWLSL
jgi:hypothetical protein